MNANLSPARAGPPFWRLLLLASALLWQGMAFAVSDPQHVTFTLTGCRLVLNTNTPLGDFDYVCSDGAYTPGNLGVGWNELDLVPYRIVADAGNAAPANQTYAFSLAADNCDGSTGTIYDCADSSHRDPGYDDMSVPVLNTDLSDGSCVAPTVSALGVAAPGVGGIDVSIYRTVTLTQLKNTICVYDYYQRLALGSHTFPGSSLHSNLLNQLLTTTGIGAHDVSIPVREIAPQSLSKDMSAVENATVVWELTKQGTPANVSFGDVCAVDAPTSLPASITITWTKSAATPEGITVTTHVYATNPAARDITVDVSDVIYQGTTQTTPLDTASTGPVNVPANSSNLLVLTHSETLPPADGNIGDYLNDVATATYTDTVTGMPIPGTTTATAQAQITQGTVSNGSAVIDDSESITGSGLTFSVATPPSIGSFLNGYDGSAVIGPVDWLSAAQTASGTITFDKTIYVTGLLVTSGTLSDTAHLTSTDQYLSAPASITTNSSAAVKLTVSKTIPDEYLTDYLNQAGDTLKVDFHIAGIGGYSNDISLTFSNGGVATLSTDLSGLTPDTFTVTETGSTFCDALDNCTTTTFLQPASNPLVVDLTVPVDGNMTGRCSGTAAFTNILNAQGVRAQVQKVTDPLLASDDPDYFWTFTLSGPGAEDCDPAIAGAGAGPVVFQATLGGDCLLSDGDYTVTETLKTGWQEDSALPNDGVETLVCAFSVNLVTDDGQTFSCTFHNSKYGHANVIKTVLGAPPSGADSFQFQLREGATLSSVGTILETLYANAGNGGSLAFVTDLVPGDTYQLCEIVMPGWLTSLSPTFVPNGSDPGADNSVRCADFTVNAGETKTFEVDNTPPPGGNARTIGFWKNWASCRQSRGHQEPVLDETLVAATPPGIKVGNFYLTTGDCRDAVNLLNKSTMTGGVKKASDPLFNMTAQLVAAELNIVAGAASCSKVNTAIADANALLVKYGFTGDTYAGPLSKADANLARNLATELDNYNNNLPSACL